MTPRPEIKFTELRRTDGRFYLEQWTIDPPAVALHYQVLRDEWDDSVEPPVRTIYEIKVVNA